ncbi:MAG: hypothetical protein ONB12_11535, partial [candidate division KSB1 bacterium]|nr:hypothetical protein [candidate division KSB1 bacterium]
MRRHAQILLLWTVLNSSLHAQETAASSSERQAGVGFRQEFNSYLWTADLNWLQMLSPKWQFAIQESYKSSLLHTTSEGNRWKDDQTFHLEAAYLFSPKLRAFARAGSMQFFDKQSGYANDLESASALLGAQWKPVPKITTRFAFGPKREQRLSHDDRGAWLGGEVRGDSLRWHDYDHRLAFSIDQDRFPLRRNANLSTLYKVGRTFAPGVADSISL